MGKPNIIINFKSKASTAIRRGSRGIVAIIIKETTKGIHKIENITDEALKSFTEDNVGYIKRAFLGGINPIKHVMVIATDTVANGLRSAESIKFDYIACPPDITTEECADVVTLIKKLRENGQKVKAVLPKKAADHEGIINVTTDNIQVKDAAIKYSAAQYCSRIAGLLAGTPLQQSATYYVLPEVKSVPYMTKTQIDEAIDRGELILFSDGDKARVARAVNSLVSVGSTKSEDYKSCKIIDIIDMIHSDIKSTAEDIYIGKYPNNYDNKCNLIVSIQAYLEQLRNEELLDKDINVGIDMESQISYLKDKQYDIDNMTELEIKEANTGTNVFLEAKFKVINAIEDITLNCII